MAGSLQKNQFGDNINNEALEKLANKTLSAYHMRHTACPSFIPGISLCELKDFLRESETKTQTKFETFLLEQISVKLS